ncbi:MAG: ribonuclease III [Cytophagales bacterium]|nr:ribonuclease III [Cytophagales bacterium]
MNLLFKKLLFAFTLHSEQDKRLIASIQNIVGSKPLNLSLYRLVTQHVSVAKHNHGGVKESNERLEYLGDAVLGAVVAEFLYKKYPYKSEGFLTEVRSRIVNRESLNELGRKIGLHTIVRVDDIVTPRSHKSLYGDALEALVGAVYLDRGYLFCRKFILKKLLQVHFNLDEIVSTSKNYKSKIIEWAQKNSRMVYFHVDEVREKKQKRFIAHVIVDEETYGIAEGFSKKKAEQLAAQKSCEMLEII